MDLFTRIAAGTIAVIGYITYFGTCFFAARTGSWSKFGLGIVLAGLTFGIAMDGVLIATGVKDTNRILIWGIASGIFGSLSFFLLWLTHGLIIPRVLNRISKIVGDKRR